MHQSGFRLDLAFFQSQPISLTLLIILRLTLRVPPFIISHPETCLQGTLTPEHQDHPYHTTSGDLYVIDRLLASLDRTKSIKRL